MAATALLVFAAVHLPGCFSAQDPDYTEILVLEGSPYERGYEHGAHFASKIRSLYTQILTISLLPYLNREQPDVEAFLTEYQRELYDDGRFSYEVLKQSGYSMLEYIPTEYVEEMQGVADGAGLPFEEILVLNTFVDTMMSFRGITFFIKQIQAPLMQMIAFTGPLAADGVDNDGDGQIDEEGEGIIDPWDPSPWASMVEVPVDSAMEFLLSDVPEGVNGESIRIQMGTDIYTPADGSITSEVVWDQDLSVTKVTFRPPMGFPPASVVSLIFQAGDQAYLTDPPPVRSRYMRDERIVFTTQGYGKLPHEIENRGEDDGRSQPPSWAFAVRNSATPDGRVMLGHHFMLLDAGTAHKHTVVLVHKPDNGIPHVTVGWTGLVWGFSGMNQAGVSMAVNTSDTLDNPLVGRFAEDYFSAVLLQYGMPIGFVGREILSKTSTVQEGLKVLEGQIASFGWNVLLADASRDMALAEMDTNILVEPDEGFYVVSPDPANPANLDPWGRPLASVGPDDLRAASHYVANTEDLREKFLVIFNVKPQRFWSSFYLRSMRTFWILGDQIRQRYGAIDVEGAKAILGYDPLTDDRDSMNAVLYEPESGTFHFAMGRVPATDAEFETLDLNALVEGGGQ